MKTTFSSSACQFLLGVSLLSGWVEISLSAAVDEPEADVSASAQAESRLPDGLEVIAVKRIWSEPPHNAFMSLIRFNGRRKGR